jgi:cytochrome c biogenesis protein CcmG/thiol:disulfide interchange protein DsbE
VRWVVIGIAAALVGLLSYGVASQGTDNKLDVALQEGKRPPAPDASLRKLGDTGSGAIDDYRGKVVLVNFWASWCDPCKDEAPLVEKTHQELAAHGGTVVGVDTRDASDAALQFVKAHGMTYPSLRDGSGDYANKWGLTGYPESFLLDKDGRVVAINRGPITKSWVAKHVTPLINQ